MSDFQFQDENSIKAVFNMEVGREMNDHNKLYNRYADDQHPISAIIGLTEALAEGSSNLQAEISRAEAAEQALDTKIEAETSRAETEEQALDSKIADEITRAIGTENALDTALGNEVNARTQADSTLQENINTVTDNLATETRERKEDIADIEGLIPANATALNKLTDKAYVDSADNNLQSQIDAIVSSSNVFDVVGTYAQLQAYDISSVPVNDIIKVLQDETHGNASTYYRCIETAGVKSWYYIGSEGASYTKAEADEKFATNTDLENEITAREQADTELNNAKADKATTLSGYGITNAYTKTEVDTALSGKQDSLTKSQLKAVNSGISSDKVTQYDGYASGKANVGLDNLDADGQMIIDSQNGTISNCILEIPQNIKLTLENNVLTVKKGSVGVVCTSTYTTVTVANDVTLTLSQADGTYMVFLLGSGSGLTATLNSKVSSGSSLPETGLNGDRFFNTTDKQMYYHNVTNWQLSSLCYPVCLIQITSGVASFVKFSDGRDCIFNGIGFVGQTKFIYPNVKVLEPIGKNADGTLKSREYTNNSLQLSTNGGTYNRRIFINENVFQITINNWHYVEDDNMYYDQNNVPFTSGCIELGNCFSVNDIVTDFTIRQPYEGARDLLTDDIKEEVATKQVDVTTLTGYDSTQTQTLKNINGVLQWVTD